MRPLRDRFTRASSVLNFLRNPNQEILEGSESGLADGRPAGLHSQRGAIQTFAEIHQRQKCAEHASL